MQDLKDRKQALTAAYLKEGKAYPVGLEDGVLTVVFSQEQDFYVREVDKPQHREALGKVLEERLGVRPQLEFRVAGAERSTVAEAPEVAPNRDVSATRPREVPVPEPEPRYQEDMTAGAENAGREDDRGAGKIQNQQEVFEMMRELFPLDGNQTGGG